MGLELGIPFVFLCRWDTSLLYITVAVALLWATYHMVGTVLDTGGLRP